MNLTVILSPPLPARKIGFTTSSFSAIGYAIVGTINLSDGKVTDANQKVLGFARGIRVDWIACYYFFDFFKPI